MMRPWSASERGRQRLVEPWTLAVIMVVIAALLIIVFPRKLLIQQREYAGEATAISVAYLQALLRSQPGDTNVRINLVQQLLELGQLDAARNALEPLETGKTNLGPDVDWLSFRILSERYLSLPTGAPERARLEPRVSAKLSALVGKDIPKGHLERLARLALAIEHPGTASRLYEQLAEEEPERAIPLLTLAGKWALAAGESDRAASLYWRVVRNGDDAQSRVAADELIRARLAQNAPDKALDAVEALLPRFPRDTALLAQGTRVALAAGRTDSALQFSLRRLRLAEPTPSLSLLRQVYDLQVGAGRLADAAETGARIVKRAPNDAVFREHYAQLLEWAGQSHLAVTQWLWIEHHAPARRRQPPLWKLAMATYAFHAGQSLLLEIARNRPLSREELDALLYATQQGGHPEYVITRLRRLLARSPGREGYWRALLSLLDATQREDAYIAAYRAFGKHFPLTPEDRVELARALVIRGQPERALDLLKTLDPPADAADGDYWDLRADLAWQLEDVAEVLRAYTVMSRGDRNFSRTDRERYITAALVLGHRDIAARVAHQAWLDDHSARYLVLAMNAAMADRAWDKAGQWYREGELAGVADARFWVAAAQYLQHTGDVERADRAFRNALATASGDNAIRAAYLWFLLDHNRDRRLAAVLPRWADPEVSTDLGSALAMGFARIGHYGQALAWFGREYRSNRKQPAWLLSYADVLDRSGRTEAAYRLRRYVLRHSPDHWDDEAGPALITATTDIAGPSAAWNRLARLRPEAAGGPWYETLAGWYLGRQNHAAAQRVAQQAAAAGITLPAWQRLSLALAGNDLNTLRAVLAGSEGLSPADRATARIRLGESGRALDTALADIDSGGNDSAASRGIAVEVEDERPSGAQVAAETRSFGTVRLNSLTARTRQAFDGFDLGMDISRFQATNTDVVKTSAFGDETAARLRIAWHGMRWRSEAALDLARNGDSSLVGGTLEGEWRWRGNFRSTARLDIGQLPAISGPARLLARRDGFEIENTGELDGRSFWTLSAGWNRYASRAGDELIGEGPRFRAVVGEHVMAGDPWWSVRLEAEWEQFSRPGTLPSAIRDRLTEDTSPDAFLPERYGAVLVGSHWYHGDPGMLTGRAPTPRYSLDVTAGTVYPRHGLAFGVSAGLGWRVLGRDELALQLSVSREMAATAEGTSGSGTLTYTYWFGR